LNTAEQTADIVIIQEPWMGHNEQDNTYYTISHPSFTSLISNTPSSPRTITFISKTNPHLTCNLQNNMCRDEDIQILKINTATIETLYLFNIYNERPRNNRDLPYTIERTLSQIELPKRTILAGDFNAHHPWWNSNTNRMIRHQPLISIASATTNSSKKIFENNSSTTTDIDKPFSEIESAHSIPPPYRRLKIQLFC